MLIVNDLHSTRRYLVKALMFMLALVTDFARAADEDAEKIPEPEDITLETKDSVSIHATFYPGVLKKKSIPFLMVHGWEGNRGQFDKLALELQKRGNAILTLDLRGHGDSLHFKGGDDRKIDLTRFAAGDIDRMMLDIEAGKKFLMERNNAGELNIEALCVVAAEEGAIPAVKWTAADWNAPMLPAYKQGQDVKALILLSPVLALKGVNALPAFTQPALQKKLAMFIAAGKKDQKTMSEAKKIHTNLSSLRAKGEASGLTLETLDTNLQGSKLITTPGLPTTGMILQFVKKRLVDELDQFEWADRTRP